MPSKPPSSLPVVPDAGFTRPPICWSAAWLSTAQLRPRQPWKEQSTAAAAHPGQPHTGCPLSPPACPPRPHCQLKAKCPPSRVGPWGLGARTGHIPGEAGFGDHTNLVATRTHGKASWKQLVGRGPWTRNTTEQKPTHKGFCPETHTPARLGYIQPTSGP